MTVVHTCSLSHARMVLSEIRTSTSCLGLNVHLYFILGNVLTGEGHVKN